MQRGRTAGRQPPLPKTFDELLDHLHGSTIFFKINLKIEYYQIHIKEKEILKITFNSRYKYYKFTMMFFGLMNALATFNRLMQDIFKRRQINKYVLVFFDDILIYTKNEEDHEAHVREVLAILREH